MKKIVFLIICVIFTFSAQAIELSKVDIQKHIDSGNVFYKKNLFPEAIESYQKALLGNYESANLYFNLGNAYFRTTEYASAILNYERALRISPSNEDIRQNLNIANAKIVDKVEEVPQLFITRWANVVVNFFSSNQWAILSIVLIFLACLAIGVFFISSAYKLKKTGFYAGISLLVLAIGAFSCAQLNYHRQNSKNEAIVMQPLIVAKGSPSDSGLDKFVIHEGTKVKLDDVVDNWMKIRLPDGNIGWVEKEGIEII